MADLRGHAVCGPMKNNYIHSTEALQWNYGLEELLKMTKTNALVLIIPPTHIVLSSNLQSLQAPVVCCELDFLATYSDFPIVSGQVVCTTGRVLLPENTPSLLNKFPYSRYLLIPCN